MKGDIEDDMEEEEDEESETEEEGVAAATVVEKEKEKIGDKRNSDDEVYDEEETEIWIVGKSVALKIRLVGMRIEKPSTFDKTMRK